MPGPVPYSPVATVAPRDPGLARFTQQATPEDFGSTVGQAEAGLGNALNQGGDVLANHALAFQELNNETAAKDGATQFDRKSIDLAFDPQNGYFSKMGKDAYDGYNDALDSVEKTRQDVLAGLPNDRARAMADQVIVRKQAQLQESMAQHAQQQRKVWMIGASDARIAATTDSAAAFYNDDYKFGQAIGTIKGEVLSQGEIMGKSADEVNQAQAAAVSKAWIARIDHMAVADPVGAQDLYRKNIGSVDGAAQASVEKKLKEETYPILSRQLANRVMGGQATAHVDALTDAVVTPDLVPAMIQQESGGLQSAVSGKGAVGIMQLMPDTAREVAGKLGVPYDPDRLKNDATYNKALGTAYLQQMLGRYGGNQTLALAAYNAGPGRVDGWLKTIGNPNAGEINDQTFADKIPIAETKNYVNTINAKVQQQPGTGPSVGDVRQNLAQWMGQTRQAATAMYPNDPTFADQAVSHVVNYAAEIEHGQVFSEKAARDVLLMKTEGFQQNASGEFSPIMQAQRPTSLDQLLADPDAKKAWATADPIVQTSILARLEHNAKGIDPPMSPNAMSAYYRLKGESANDPVAFGAEKLATPDLMGIMPSHLLLDLMNVQAAQATRQARDVDRGANEQHAMMVARGPWLASGFKIPTKPGDDKGQWDQFTGRLLGSMDQFIQTNKKSPQDQDIRNMTNQLLAQGTQPNSGWIFDNSVRLFQVDRDQFKINVPAAERPKIISDYKSIYGFEPTDATITDIYSAKVIGKGK